MAPSATELRYYDQLTGKEFDPNTFFQLAIGLLLLTELPQDLNQGLVYQLLDVLRTGVYEPGDEPFLNGQVITISQCMIEAAARSSRTELFVVARLAEAALGFYEVNVARARANFFSAMAAARLLSNMSVAQAVGHFGLAICEELFDPHTTAEQKRTNLISGHEHYQKAEALFRARIEWPAHFSPKLTANQQMRYSLLADLARQRAQKILQIQSG